MNILKLKRRGGFTKIEFFVAILILILLASAWMSWDFLTKMNAATKQHRQNLEIEHNIEVTEAAMDSHFREFGWYPVMHLEIKDHLPSGKMLINPVTGDRTEPGILVGAFGASRDSLVERARGTFTDEDYLSMYGPPEPGEIYVIGYYEEEDNPFMLPTEYVICAFDAEGELIER